MSEIKRLEQVTSWKRVLNAARRTIGKEPLDKEPSNSWKAKILLAEHSPIRLLEYDWSWNTIKQWVTAHLVRHHEGCEKFVHSQRGDRRELPCERDRLPQGARNDMDMTANAQALKEGGRYSAVYTLPKLNEYHLGELMYMLALSVAYEGELADVAVDYTAPEGYLASMDIFVLSKKWLRLQN